MLGNMTILTHPQNREADNNPYDAKRRILKTSGFALSKHAATEKTWNAEVVAAGRTSCSSCWPAVGVCTIPGNMSPMTDLAAAADTPILVFGGPYSNVRALTALRARAEQLGIPPSHSMCTGDVVAYCVEPEETTAAMRAWGCHVVAGNCEEQLAAGSADCACGFEEGSECDRLAKGWYPFANERISPDSRAWMAGLPSTLTFSVGGLAFRVIHGGVRQTNRFVFASQSGRAGRGAGLGRKPMWWSRATAACRSSRRSAAASGSTQA